ncbi:MAG: Na/Pi cotransporter family protein, partial [Clostridiales bacterium]|nr:Na/Pi cotransporter family protein [Clostridiales bacterium]
FNISGALLFIWFVKPYAAFIQYISPKGVEVEVISRQIANAHTIFNLTMTIIWIFLLGVMVKIVTKIIPDGKEGLADLSRPCYLDKNVLAQPAAALRLVAQEVLHCSDMVKTMLLDVKESVGSGSTKILQEVRTYGEALDALHVEINEYLAELFSAGVLTEQQASQTAQLLYVLSDVERMGGLAVELGGSMQERKEKKYNYSREAMDDLERSLTYIEGMYADAMTALASGSQEPLQRSLEQKETVLDLDIKMRKEHMQRVNRGTCKKELSVPFMQILHCIDRMGNSCVNLAEVAANQMSFTYFIGEDSKQSV